MRGFRIAVFVMLSVVFGAGLWAETSPEVLLNVPKIDASKLGWGRHSFPVKIANNGEYLKYISVVGNVKCLTGENPPARKVFKNYALFPGDTVTGEGILLVPGQYGEIEFELKVYDVIDTLDQLMESQAISSQSGKFSVPVPSTVAPYVKKGFTLPPLVGRHVDFDNDFSKIVPFLVAQGKSTGEIAQATGCDTAFVVQELAFLIGEKFYRKEGSRYLTSVASIEEEEAAAEKILAMKAAESLAAQIGTNFKTYRQVIDSLVKAQMLDSDSNSFMDGGTILYRPYPVLTTLLLWYDLGSSFINNGTPLLLFDGTDFCNAWTPAYMYVVSGDKSNNGKQHFAFMRNYRSYQFYYGDTIPEIYCPEGFMLNPQEGIPVQSEYRKEFFPEGFMVDSAQTRPMLNHLRYGTEPIIKKASDDLISLGNKFNKTAILPGQRYWFWNMVTTRVVQILTENGAITKRGNGQFRLDGMSM